MPKATRAKEENETPKKRSRKAKPSDGSGTDAVEPVTTAPAFAETKPPVNAAKAAPRKRTSPGKAADGNGAHPAEPVASVPMVTDRAAEAVAAEAPAPPATHNGRVPEELVRRRAYELYLQRRGQGGSPEQDWFQALREISAQYVA